MYFLLAVIAIILVWSLWGYLSSRTEQTAYTVLKFGKDYEIRIYPAHLVAQTTVQGPYQVALTAGFRIIAGYIFGANTEKESIAMTAPVVEQRLENQKIAMTAPVMASIQGDSHTITFGMPRAYTLATLPIPTDPRVTIATIPEKKIAVRRFSWFRSNRRIQAKKQELLAALQRDHMPVKGEVQYAGYNAPWTPPWMTRNEVLAEVG